MFKYLIKYRIIHYHAHIAAARGIGGKIGGVGATAYRLGSMSAPPESAANPAGGAISAVLGMARRGPNTQKSGMRCCVID